MSARIFTILISVLVGMVLGYSVHGILSAQTIASSDGARHGAPAFPSERNLAKLDRTGSPRRESALSISEVKRGLEDLQEITDPQQRLSRFGVLLQRWLKIDGRSAFDYVESLPEGEMKQRGMALVAEVLSRSDPQFLAGQTLAMPGSRSSGELIRGLAEIWAQTDVPNALAWAAQLREGVEKKDALLLIRSQWAFQDPEGAAGQIGGLPADSSTANLITTIAARLGASDPAKAAEWTVRLSETQRTLAAASLAGVWAQRDPAAAGNFAAQLPPGEIQNEAAKAVVSSWASQDPRQTADWVLQFPAGDLQEQGIRQVVSAWNTKDPGGVQKWAMDLPAGATRDFALKTYSETIAYWAPEKAAEFTGLINDRLVKEQSVETIMRSWTQVDPASAKTWFSALEVSDELKIRLQMITP